MSKLSGKVAIITGATSGIGRAAVKLFAAEGAIIAFTGRRKQLGEALQAELQAAGVQALFLSLIHI